MVTQPGYVSYLIPLSVEIKAPFISCGQPTLEKDNNIVESRGHCKNIPEKRRHLTESSKGEIHLGSAPEEASVLRIWLIGQRDMGDSGSAGASDTINSSKPPAKTILIMWTDIAHIKT